MKFELLTLCFYERSHTRILNDVNLFTNMIKNYTISYSIVRIGFRFCFEILNLSKTSKKVRKMPNIVTPSVFKNDQA